VPRPTTHFERHADTWRAIAIILPAVLAGSLAGDVAEGYGLMGVRRTAVACLVAAASVLVLHTFWGRVFARLARRHGSRPTV
jgi:hypothetical protein